MAGRWRRRISLIAVCFVYMLCLLLHHRLHSPTKAAKAPTCPFLSQTDTHTHLHTQNHTHTRIAKMMAKFLLQRPKGPLRRTVAVERRHPESPLKRVSDKRQAQAHRQKWVSCPLHSTLLDPCSFLHKSCIISDPLICHTVARSEG